jgi:H+-transporting ATPase
MHYTVGMTGNGVKDAPALKRPDVGIVVAGATDTAPLQRVLFSRSPAFPQLFTESSARGIFERVSNFITYRIAAALQLPLFFFIAILAFHPADFSLPENLDRSWPWPNSFHMPVIMLMLITLMERRHIDYNSYDNANANTTPDRWNLPALFLTSTTLGIVSCFSSSLLLYFVLDSWSPNSFLRKPGMPPLHSYLTD